MLPKFSKKPVEPAFPLKPETNPCKCRGMTLRDYAACAALPAILQIFEKAPANSLKALYGDDANVYEIITHQAYHYADAMLAARKATEIEQ